MKRFIGILLILVLIKLGFGQSFSIGGTVQTYQGVGVSNWLVTIESTPGIWPYYFNQVYTDSAGQYLVSGAINDSVTLYMTVSTYDCAMDLVDTSFAINIGQSVQADFTICDPTPCEANYNYVVTDTTSGQTLQFFNTSTGPYYQVLWDFGDGTTSTESSPIHTFAPGSWVVCLVISDPLPPSTCSDVECKTIQIETASPCSNSFAFEANGMSIAFTGETNGTKPATYSWQFGDDTFGQGQTISHQYSYAGIFEVTLTTVDEDSCTAVSSQFILVMDTNCQANFTWTTDSLQTNEIHFTNTSIGNGITSFEWSFGDGSTTTFPDPVHTFTPGTYQVCLTIYSGNCTHTYCETITINGQQNCQASFTYLIDPQNGLSIHFNDQSTSAIEVWVWDFGDGNESLMSNPDHTYEAPGVFNVCLTVYTSDSLCQSTYCQTITVNPDLYFPVIGQVLANFFPADGVSVELYKSANNTPILTDTAFTGEFGAFAFYTVPQGEYFIKANPEPTSSIFGNYLPTYSGNTVLWEQAVALNVTQSTVGADISLVAIPQLTQGNGVISGQLKELQYEKSNNYHGISKVPVFLFSTAMELQSATYTDAEGHFSFSNVPYGNFIVMPEITGLHAEAFPVSLDANNSTYSGITFTITELGIQYGVDNSLPIGISSIGLPSPNPTQGSVSINMEVSQNLSGYMVLSSINGSAIEKTSVELTLGTNLITLDFTAIPKGVYALFLQTTNTYVFVSKIIIIQ
jgi:PKD repeat protein